MGITPSRTLLIAVRPRVSSSALWPGAVRDGWLASLWHARWRSVRPLGSSRSASHEPCKRETREVSAVVSPSFWNTARPFCWEFQAELAHALDAPSRTAAPLSQLVLCSLRAWVVLLVRRVNAAPLRPAALLFLPAFSLFGEGPAVSLLVWSLALSVSLSLNMPLPRFQDQ